VNKKGKKSDARKRHSPRARPPADGGNAPPRRRTPRARAANEPEARPLRREPRETRDVRETRPNPPQPSSRRGGAPEVQRRDPPPRRPVAPIEVADTDDGTDEAPELGVGAPIVPPSVRYEAEVSPTIPPPLTPAPRDLEAQIRALEARLDGLIRRSVVSDESDSYDAGENASAEESRTLTTEPADAVTADYVTRQWGREALRSRVEEVDDFGLDPNFEAKVRPGIDLLYQRYFRVDVEGIHHVPRAGRTVVVANHSGTLPLDGMMLRAAMRHDHPTARDLRWLAEDFVFHLPFAGVFLNRIGAVRACPENAERLLEKDSLIAVFPEGVQGIKKLFRDRYRLQRFGRGGYIRLCLRTRTPLVPCAIIGAEETNPLIYRFEWLAELFRLPYLPVTPTFPLLGPLGLLPAPTRWKLRFGEPISFDSYGPEAADDDLLIGRLSERVRGAIQSLLDTGLRGRKSVWFG
jgi:1-acyl-sn-glycerol-3-phosphate acyltransferase